MKSLIAQEWLFRFVRGSIGVALAVCAAPMMALGAPATRPAAVSATAAVRDESTRTVSLFVGQTRIIDAPWPVRRVSVNAPGVADVDVTSPRRVQIQGKAPGIAEVLIWSETGETWQARVEVEADARRLEGQLKKLFPGTALEVAQLGNVVAVRGTLARAEQVAQLHRFFELSKIEYVDATNVAGVQQVQLQVKVAEVSRTALRALGINAVYAGKDFFGGIQIGSSSGPLNPVNIGIPKGTGLGGSSPFSFLNDAGVASSATLFGGFPHSDLQVFIEALAENQYLRVMAEPTLVSLSGKEASFLAGGEFPIPIAQLGGSGTTQISIDYKEFGIRLRFTPTVLGDGTINLHVMPEVSQLSDVGAVMVNGTSVPSLLTRRVETTLEMQSGQTFAIAGLISRSDAATADRVPGLGDLPVLGTLFRSVRYTRSDTELLVLVTASLVEPTSTEANPLLPGMLHEVPNDWEFYWEGRTDSKDHPRLAPAQTESLKRLGLNHLCGPSGWATYEKTPDKVAGDGIVGR